ncbi:MAG: helix-turn-helix domain-containing protein [Spirochaetota bacterium]
MKILEKDPKKENSFGEMLRFWRKINHISQMDFSLDIEISTRHLSFLETGKSKPSYNLVLKISNCLKLPFRQRNAFLIAAGYVPAFQEEDFTSKNFLVVREALQRMLEKHEPYPAFVVNTSYKILMKNKGYDNLVKLYAGDKTLKKYDNAMQILFSKDGLQPFVKDWHVIEYFLLSRLKEEIVSTQNKELSKLYLELCKKQKERSSNNMQMDSNLPVMTLVLEKELLKTSFFTTITTLGTPLDVTTQELKIELLFPSNDETKKLFF